MSETPPPKRARTMPPTDVIVQVGEGKNMKEFNCYSVMLRVASEYFEAMLSSPMQEAQTKTISFVDRDPDEWEEVYKFIDSRYIREAKITKDNVNTLIPWFHLFQMTDLLEHCDAVIANSMSLFSNFQTGDVATKKEEIGKAKNEIYSFHLTSQTYGLERTLEKCSKEIKHFLSKTPGLVEMEDVVKIISHLTSEESVSEKDEHTKFLFEWIQGKLPDGIVMPLPNYGLLLENPLLPHTILSECRKDRVQAAIKNHSKNRQAVFKFWRNRMLFEGIATIPAEWQ